MKFLLALSLFFFSSFLYADNQQFLTAVKTMMKQERYRVYINEMNITKDSTNIIKDIENILPLYLETKNAFEEENEDIRFSSEKPKHPIIYILNFIKLLGKYIQYLDNTHHKEKLTIIEKILNDTQKLMYHTHKTIHYYVSWGIYKDLLESLECHNKDIQNIFRNYPPKDADYFFEIFETSTDIDFKESKKIFVRDLKITENKKDYIEILIVAVDKLFAIHKAKALEALKKDSEKAINEYEAYCDKLSAKNHELVESMFLSFDEIIQTSAYLLVVPLFPFVNLDHYHQHQEIIERYNTFISCP